MSIPQDLDPERFSLTKQDVLDYMNLIKKRWQKNKIKNALFIVGLDGIIGMTLATPENLIKKFWSEVLKLMWYLYQKNAFANDTNSNENWTNLKEMMKKKMEQDLEEPIKDAQ